MEEKVPSNDQKAILRLKKSETGTSVQRKREPIEKSEKRKRRRKIRDERNSLDPEVRGTPDHVSLS